MSSVGEKKRQPIRSSAVQSMWYFFDYTLRTVLTFNVVWKLLAYFVLVSVLSIAGSIQRPGASYFSDKRNIFNQWFVKLGWGWTMSGVIVLLVLAYHVQSLSNSSTKNVMKAVARLVVLTLYWYISTHGFEWIEQYTGSCTKSSLVVKKSCVTEGHRWLGFDISGHCFLLTFALAIINEECHVLQDIPRMLDSIEGRVANTRKDHAEQPYHTYRTCLRIAMLLLLFLTFLWEFMLMVTALYFHTITQKLLGMLTAVLGWFMTYRVLNIL